MKTKHRQQTVVITAIYLLLAFLSAFELFLIQPLIAKYILPWFGGASSVWTACLLFFQTMLFVGYFYAYLISYTRIRTQVITHISLLLLSLATLGWQLFAWGTTVTPPRNWTQELLTHSPTFAVVVILTVSIGLQYIILSSTSPLIQSWFYGKGDERSKPLYFFYAISNVGSLLALLLYPLLLEPLSGIHQQASLWSFGYIAFALVCAICSIHALKTAIPNSSPQESPQPPSTIKYQLPLIWMGLSACATLMLISITNQICTNVAPVPLLWLLPLSLYLLAFIVCFSTHSENIPTIAALIMLPATALLLFIVKHELQLGILPQLVAYIIVLSCTSMLCLGQLHKQRPSPKHLTLFYLMISLGGAMGGIFVGIVAPLIFTDYWELRIGLMISCALATWILLNKPWMAVWKIPTIVASLIILFTLARMPQNAALTTVEKSRSFYGILKVMQETQPRGVNVYSLMHGKICHGLQFDRGPFSRIPNAYFGPNSGIGIAFANHPKRKHSEDREQNTEPGTQTPERAAGTMHVGVLGLGIGTVAAYGEHGDNFRFYELNPDVIDMATNTAHFRYISNCPADVKLITGDARLSMEQELKERGSHNFDILNMDAFNGDAIPVHLLTIEAFKTYLAHLNPDNGVLAIQITNMYLDLRPVLTGIAKHYGLSGYIIEGTGDQRITSDCLWVLLSRNENYTITAPEGAKVSPLDTSAENLPLWTDDFSNLLTIIKRSLLVKSRK